MDEQGEGYELINKKDPRGFKVQEKDKNNQS